MKTTIEVKGIEQSVGKTSGKTYWKIDTNLGPMTCFRKDIVDKLIVVGKNPICVEMVESGEFKNIRGISSDQSDNKVEIVKPIQDAYVEARKSKDTSIYTSYVKDLVISGIEIEEAIKLVKQAKEAF